LGLLTGHVRVKYEYFLLDTCVPYGGGKGEKKKKKKVDYRWKTVPVLGFYYFFW